VEAPRDPPARGDLLNVVVVQRGRVFREPEVQDLDPPVVQDEEVVGLEIAVRDPRGVGRGQSVGNLRSVIKAGPLSVRSVLETGARA
jgi:hypothetical protein